MVTLETLLEPLLKNGYAMDSLRVFLVENHEDTVKYMRLLLEQLSYQVCVATDMATARAPALIRSVRQVAACRAGRTL